MDTNNTLNSSQKEINKVRYEFLDLLKSIAIFLVILVHSNSLPSDFTNSNTFASYCNYIINALCFAGVPIFFFVNGALLLNKNFSLKNHYIKIIKIFILTYIWSIITFVVIILIDRSSNNMTKKDIIIGILSFKPGYTAYLWFLPALAILYMFVPLIKKIYDDKEYFIFFLVIILIFSFGFPLLSSIDYLFSTLFHKQYLSIILSSLSLFNPFKNILSYPIGYFMVGGILFKNRNRLISTKLKILSIFMILLSIILWVSYGIFRSFQENKVYPITNTGYDSICALFFVISTFILCLNYKSQGILGDLISIIGKNSLGIYLIHIIIARLFFPIYNFPLFLGNIILNLLLTFFNLIICLFVCIILKRIPFVKKLLVF